MTAREAAVIWLNAPGEIELRIESLRVPGDNEVLCETIVSAVSPGTELAAFKGLPPLRPGVIYPRLLGYCNVARVLEVGSAVDGVQPGDRVLTFVSHRSAYVITEAEILYKLPETARPEDIACAYLFHLGYNAILRGDVRAGSRVVVIGLGVLGLTTVAMGALAGARVFALSDHVESRSIALRMGAEAVFVRNDLSSLTDNLGLDLADLVVSTTNSWSDWQVALQVAGQRGMVAVLGFPGRGEPLPLSNPLDSQYFYMKQLRIEAVGVSPERRDGRGFCRFNERANIAYIADQIMRGHLNPSLLVSNCYAGTNAHKAYMDLMERRSSPTTYLFQWNTI